MNKKDEEKYFLLLFKELFDQFPNGEIISNESPDFIIKTKTANFGIELSKIYQKSKNSNLSSQASDSIGNSIMNIVTEQLNNHEIPFLHALINITFHRAYQKKERMKIGNKIAKVIIDNIPHEKESIEITNNFENESLFPFEVSSIHILNHPLLEKHFVSFPRYGFMQRDMIDNIQKLLNKKDVKILNYEPLDNQWLLIYVLGGSSGSFFEPSNKTLLHEYRTKFDRIFLLLSLEQKVYELKKV